MNTATTAAAPFPPAAPSSCTLRERKSGLPVATISIGLLPGSQYWLFSHAFP